MEKYAYSNILLWVSERYVTMKVWVDFWSNIFHQLVHLAIAITFFLFEKRIL